MILFSIVWLLTIGRISFWLLPNLTEDVGFFDSFRPLYHFQSNSAAALKKDDDDDAASGEGVTREDLTLFICAMLIL